MLRSAGFQFWLETAARGLNVADLSNMNLVQLYFSIRGLSFACYEMGCIYGVSHLWSFSSTSVVLWCLSISVEDDIIFSFMSLSCSICLCNLPFIDTWCCLLCVVLPGRLCDGLSSPCRLQATSCWAPPATSSSCCRKRRTQRRVWSCHKKAGSDSCRACCSEKHASNDGL